MESFKLQGFVHILREAMQIFSRNRKLMTSITLVTLLISSLMYLFDFILLKLLIQDLVTKLLLVTLPSSPDFANNLLNLKRDVGFLFGFQLIHLLFTSVAFLFLATITIIASAMIHSRTDITFKDLLHRALKSWKRPFITWLCITPFGLGYLVLALAILLLLRLVIEDPTASLGATIAVGILAWGLYVFISVALTLAFVVSVLEAISGIKAIRKATKIARGMMLDGFLLNLFFGLLSSVLVQGIRWIPRAKSAVVQIMIGLLVVNFVSLVRVFWWMAYTILYYKCKQIHQEKVELQGVAEYTKIPTAPQVGEDVP